MPRFSRLRIAALEELAHELRFAPPEALERNLDRIETLAAEIDPSTAYPLDWIAFKVTAFRRELPGAPVTIAGKELLAELPALSERLSAAARLDAATLASRGAIDRASLCQRWQVSPKTLERYKREGLIGRRAIGEFGKPRLVFMPVPVAWFERAHSDLIGRAASFSRLGIELESRIVRRAARYQRRFGCSLNQIAKRLADRFDRSHEAVRQLLKRARRDHDNAPEFRELGLMTSKQRATALRAVARGIDPALIAARWKRPRSAIARATLVARADRLWSLLDTGQLRAGADLIGTSADDTRLFSSEAVSTGLGGVGHTDLLDLIRSGRVRSVIVGVEEHARARARAVLLHRAATMILAMPRSAPTAAAVDSAETSLRWAILLKAELVRSQIPLMIETLEGLLGGPLEELPGGLNASAMKDLIATSFGALAEAVDQFDASKAGRQNQARLAAPATLGITRAATRWIRASSAPNRGVPARSPGVLRAAGRLFPGVHILDWTLSVSPWRSWLWPDPRMRATLLKLDPRERTILERRYAWTGLAPASLDALARELGAATARLTTLERHAIRSALKAVRANPKTLARA